MDKEQLRKERRKAIILIVIFFTVVCVLYFIASIVTTKAKTGYKSPKTKLVWVYEIQRGKHYVLSEPMINPSYLEDLYPDEYKTKWAKFEKLIVDTLTSGDYFEYLSTPSKYLKISPTDHPHTFSKVTTSHGKTGWFCGDYSHWVKRVKRQK